MRHAALLVLLAATCAGNVSVVDHLRNKFYTLERVLWKNVTDLDWNSAGLVGDVELTKAFVAFDAQIESVPRPPRMPVKNFLWTKAVEDFQVINGFYDNFVKFIKRQAQPGGVPAPVREWLDLAESVLIDPASSVVLSVKRLSNLLEHGDMFRTVLQEDQTDLCELEVSPHQLIYDMYNTISLTEIKGYAMMQFSWMLLRVYEKGNYTQEASITRKRYAERTSRTAVAARAALSMARRDVYRCHPAEHKRGETYAEVTRFLQGYIENEVDMNSDRTCREDCGYYTVATQHGCFDQSGGLCTKQKQCKGRILNCQYIDSDMWVCPASRASSRRYEFIQYENGRMLGKSGTCRLGTTKVNSPLCSGRLLVALVVLALFLLYVPLRRVGAVLRPLLQPMGRHIGRQEQQVDSWWRGVTHCSYCMCLCEEADTSERSFSLREALAAMEDNKVVTGVRIVKHGQVFHLQVSEGLLGARGNVTPGSWVPVQKFGVNDAGIRDGEDYHTLTYEKRAIDLDELDSPAGHILTGVRFRVIGAHLHFEIRSTMFNYTTGRLSPERSEWISNDNTDGGEQPRTKLELVKPDIPTRGALPLRVDSKHDQYIEFTNSDLEADAAQSTVPFIDIQPLQPMKGAALVSGAGVIHRGAPHSGGFLALKLLNYDQSRHVRAQLPPREDDDEDMILGLASNY